MLHKEMMGFGYLGNGGLSSPSNLSPLAPPFTVDRSNPKPNLDPLCNFNETPPYGVPFSSSLHNWQYPHSSASAPDYFSNCDSEIDSLLTTSDYCYLGSEPINPPSVHWAPPNPNQTNQTNNPFSYAGAPKQFYPPYVSQVVDDNASLVGLNEANYDLLSTSGLVPMGGSSQVDYNQGLSSLDFPPPWGGFWNGLSEGKRGKRPDMNGSFHLEDTDFPGSHVYRDYMKQVPAECLRCEENPTAAQRKYVDVLGRETNAGSLAKDQLDDSLGQNLGYSPIETSKAPIFGASTIFTESHLEAPSLEPVTFSSNRHKSYSPYEKGFQRFDSCINDCISVTKTSVMPVTKPVILKTKFPVSDTVASKSMGVGDVTAVNKKDVSSYNQALENEPLLPPSSEVKEGFLDANHLGFHTGRNDQHVFAPAFSREEEMWAKPLSKNSLDHTIKVRGGQIPDIDVLHGFTLSVSTEAFKHTANTTDSSDHHNPAEDSPCWKGAPASPFESSEAIPPQNLMKKLETRDHSDFVAVQMFPHYNESVMDFSSELCGPNLRKESLFTENSKSVPPLKNLNAILPAKEYSVADDARSKSDSVQQNRNDRDQYSSNVENPIKQYNLLNMSKSDSGSIHSPTKQLCPKEVNFTSKSKIQLHAGSVDAGISTIDTSEDGCIPLHAVENVLCSPPSEKDDGKPSVTESNPKVNIQTLASVLHNISELLLLYSFDDEWQLKEQDSKTLENAVSNINLCLSKKIEQSTPRQEPMFPKADISRIPEEGATKVKLHAMNEVGNATVGQLDSHSTHEQERIYSVSDKKIEKNVDFVSLRNDADVTRHHNMVQNIKKVLDENLPSEEDISSETLLYKNLWLNAEAELCVTGLKSRFDQVKIQMEDCKSDEAKENLVVLEKIHSSNVSPDPILDVASGSTPESNGSPKQKALVQYSCISSPRSDVNDAEASVMARFQILKCRDDNINASNVEEKSLSDGTDSAVPWQIVGNQTENRSSNVEVASCVQRHSDHNLEKNGRSYPDDPQHETVAESSVYVPDDPTTVQPYRNIMMNNQIAPGSGWYENTSLDWEDVLKDDFAWQK